MEEIQTISLPTVANGAASELFEEELKKVIANIMDVNTEANVKRSITLKMTIQPGMDRDSAAMKFEASSKLAPQLGVSTSMFIGVQAGEFVAVENDPKQMQLQLDEANKPASFPAADDSK